MKWNIDPTHSQAEFSVRHMFTRVVVGGVVDADDLDPTKSDAAA